MLETAIVLSSLRTWSSTTERFWWLALSETEVPPKMLENRPRSAVAGASSRGCQSKISDLRTWNAVVFMSSTFFLIQSCSSGVRFALSICISVVIPPLVTMLL